jgi:hypothetical protein
MRWSGRALCREDKRNAYKILAGKPQRKRPLGWSIHRWEGNINTSPREIGSEVRDCVHVVQDEELKGNNAMLSL